MDFESRIKKEMTEGIVKAVFEDVGYRVIDSGIEKILRELSCLSGIEYSALGYPDVMSMLPDFTVMDRDQTVKFLVEVKYRTKWGRSLFDEIRKQVETFGDLVVVSVNSNPPNQFETKYPSAYLRCCRVRFENGNYSLQLKYEKKDGQWNHYWKSLDELELDDDALWWAMSPLEKVFVKLKEADLDSRASLDSAIRALSGILT